MDIPVHIESTMPRSDAMELAFVLHAVMMTQRLRPQQISAIQDLLAAIESATEGNAI